MSSNRLEPASCPCKRLPLCLSSFTSAEYGDVHSLSRLGNGGKELAQRVDSVTGDTPLHLSAQHGHVAATAFLLESGCNVNGSAEHSKCTPLHRASFSGAVATMQLLVNQISCDLLAVDVSFGDKMTPLHKAAAGGRFMAVQLLMDALESRGLLGTALEAKEATGKTPLEVALDRLEHDEEAVISVARWNELAGGRPDFKKCVELLRARRPVLRRPQQNNAMRLSFADCVACDDGSCRTASWETAFRNALFESTKDALFNVGTSNDGGAVTSKPLSAIRQAASMEQGSTADINLPMATAISSDVGAHCDVCNEVCFAVFVRNGKSVCRSCRRKV